jgi:CheY-like chemotaxis protein
LPQLFGRFAQRDSTAGRSYGGLGLGLAISKQLVELHGGSISAKSPGEGLGATFTVRMPLVLVESDHEHARQREVQNIAQRDELPLTPELNGAHVLVVDDEADARDLVRMVLENQGAHVRTAASAEEAVDLLRTSQPDVLVSDIGMPGTDGHQLMRIIRAQEAKGQRLPALALTAFARADDRKRAMLAGYQAHLSKPFDVGEFLLVVAGLLDRG